MPTATAEKPKTRVVVFTNKNPKIYLGNHFVEADGTSVQVEFQREKCTKDKDRQLFDKDTDPSQAKRIGHRVKLRNDWEEAKRGIMEGLVRQKFLDHPELAQKLLATGDVQLVRKSSCSDSTWGRDSEGNGANEHGKILMKIRGELARHGKE
jgi:ribA/ribD-fused uncharacterized protein